MPIKTGPLNDPFNTMLVTVKSQDDITIEKIGRPFAKGGDLLVRVRFQLQEDSPRAKFRRYKECIAAHRSGRHYKKCPFCGLTGRMRGSMSREGVSYYAVSDEFHRPIKPGKLWEVQARLRTARDPLEFRFVNGEEEIVYKVAWKLRECRVEGGGRTWEYPLPRPQRKTRS